MSEVQSEPRQVHRSYPHTVILSDGRQVRLRLMMPGIDVYRLHAFASSLPKDDLQFLRVDITRLIVVIHWAQNIKAGLTVTVLAEEDGEVVGYASLQGDLRHSVRSWYRKDRGADDSGPEAGDRLGRAVRVQARGGPARLRDRSGWAQERPRRHDLQRRQAGIRRALAPCAPLRPEVVV